MLNYRKRWEDFFNDPWFKRRITCIVIGIVIMTLWRWCTGYPMEIVLWSYP